jgi:hypothetical protein
LEGAGLLQSLVWDWVPLPQLAEQADQLPQAPQLPLTAKSKFKQVQFDYLKLTKRFLLIKFVHHNIDHNEFVFNYHFLS